MVSFKSVHPCSDVALRLTACLLDSFRCARLYSLSDIRGSCISAFVLRCTLRGEDTVGGQ